MKDYTLDKIRNLTDPNILDKLADDDFWKIRKEVALNKHTLSSTLKKLSNDKIYNVLEAVASNPNTDVDILDSFANLDSKDWRTSLNENKINKIKAAVASNPSALNKTLEKLFTENDKIKKIVATNINTPTEFLEEMFNNKEKCVVLNYNTPSYILDNVALDDIKYNEENFYYAAYNEHRWENIKNVATNINSSINILSKLDNFIYEEISYYEIDNNNYPIYEEFEDNNSLVINL
jgi:hypothetical protein